LVDDSALYTHTVSSHFIIIIIIIIIIGIDISGLGGHIATFRLRGRKLCFVTRISNAYSFMPQQNFNDAKQQAWGLSQAPMG